MRQMPRAAAARRIDRHVERAERAVAVVGIVEEVDRRQSFRQGIHVADADQSPVRGSSTTPRSGTGYRRTTRRSPPRCTSPSCGQPLCGVLDTRGSGRRGRASRESPPAGRSRASTSPSIRGECPALAAVRAGMSRPARGATGTSGTTDTPGGTASTRTAASPAFSRSWYSGGVSSPDDLVIAATSSDPAGTRTARDRW